MCFEGEIRQMQVVFYGRVQGVSFRYTVCELAARYPVTGYVRNLQNGHVELVAEGKEQALENFLQAIQMSRLVRNIFGKHVAWNPPDGTYRQFEISFS